MTGMSKQQKEYAKAKAIYLTLKDEKTEIIRQWEAKNGEVNRDNFKAYNEFIDNTEVGMHYRQAFDNLKSAEDEMIEWAANATIHLANKQQAEQIRYVIQKAKTYEMTPKQRASLIDISFRLNAR